MTKIEMLSSTDHKILAGKTWELGICGESIDERGAKIRSLLESSCTTVLEMRYDCDSTRITIGRDSVDIDDFPDYMSSRLRSCVVLEATTLGFVEILACCRAMKRNSMQEFTFTYIEPNWYRRAKHGNILHSKDFELSDSVPGFKSIPGNLALLSSRRPVRGLFFLGYEDSRFRRAFEDLELPNASNIAVTIGIPPYKAGWEVASLANNVRVIKEENVRGGFHFCGATNPMSVIELLLEFRSGLDRNERLVVAPLGTKPHGIGVALFASLFPDVGILYDHPRKKEKRTESIGSWHRFTVMEYGKIV